MLIFTVATGSHLPHQTLLVDQSIRRSESVTAENEQASSPPNEAMNDDLTLVVDVGPDLASPRPSRRNQADLGAGLDGGAHG